MRTTDVVHGSCPNCGADAAEQFCPNCGQKLHPLFPTIREWLGDVLSETIGVEGKLLRTIAALAWPPGRLTVEWHRGRRASFVGPVRLYLIAALLFFVVWPDSALHQVLRGFSRGFIEAGDEVARRTLEQDVELASDIFAESLPGLMIVLFVPVFGMLLAVADRLKGSFVGHLVTAAHIHVVVFMIAVLSTLIAPLGVPWPTVTPLVLAVATLGFVSASIAAVYELPMWRAGMRAACVCLVYVGFIATTAGVMLGIVL